MKGIVKFTTLLFKNYLKEIILREGYPGGLVKEVKVTINNNFTKYRDNSNFKPAYREQILYRITEEASQKIHVSNILIIVPFHTGQRIEKEEN